MNQESKNRAQIDYSNEKYEKFYTMLLEQNSDEDIREIITAARDARRRGIPFIDYEKNTLSYDDFWHNKQKSGDYNLYYYMFRQCPPRGELNQDGIKELKKLIKSIYHREHDDFDASCLIEIVGLNDIRTCKMFGIGVGRLEKDGWTKRDFFLLKGFLRNEKHGTLYFESAQVEAIFVKYGNPKTMSNADCEDVIKRQEAVKIKKLQKKIKKLKAQLQEVSAELEAERQRCSYYQDKFHEQCRRESTRQEEEEENDRKRKEEWREREELIRRHLISGVELEYWPE